MATVKTIVHTCDRCSFGREKPATTKRVFAIEDRCYELDLCEPHGEAFDRDLSVWTRLARDIDNPFIDTPKPPSMFSQERTERARAVLAQSDELRQVKEQAAFIERQALSLAREAEETAFRTIPGARKWTMSKHARERMMERNYTPAEVLMAVTIPYHASASTRNSSLIVCERDGCRVVINPHTHVIVTVIEANARLDIASPALAAASH